jgi:hypothetical protein
MKRYTIIRVIGVVLFLLGATLITLQIMDGATSFIRAVGAGGSQICLGAVLFGLSLRLENKAKAGGESSDAPK